MLPIILSQIYPINDYHVVVANGQFPQHPHLTQLIQAAKTIICCDGAIDKLLNYQIQPHHIIGDCDSLSLDAKTRFKHCIIQINDQNNNDLTKAINFAYSLGLNKILILGSTGLREDHTIANIGLLANFYTLIPHLGLISDYGIFTAHSGQEKITVVPGQQISFFTLQPNTTITCQELKWPLLNQQFLNWNQGTLNQATGSYLNLTTSNVVIVYRAFELKV